MKAEFKPNKGVVYPFDSQDFYDTWALWLAYRREIKKTIKGVISEQAQLTKLARLADGDPDKAIAIIHQSIENNWQGLFNIKSNYNDKRINQAQQLAAALQQRRTA